MTLVRVNSTGDARSGIRRVCGDAIADKCKTIWGLNAEGEINGAWRDLGIPNLWYMMGEEYRRPPSCVSHRIGYTGNLALCRFHSKHVALRTLFLRSLTTADQYSDRNQSYRRGNFRYPLQRGNLVSPNDNSRQFDR